MFKDNNSRGNFGPREMVKGNWKCANANNGCSNGPDFVISELPFEPAPDRPIYCRECWAKNRPPRQNRY